MAFDAKIRLSSDTSKVDAGIAGVQRKIAGLSSKLGGTIGGLFAAGAIFAAVRNMMEYADSIQNASDRLGITVERVQELQLAAKIAGKELNVFELAFRNIDKAAQNALSGDSTAMKSFAALGVGAQQLKSSNRNDLLNATLGGAMSLNDRSNAAMYLGKVVGDKVADSLIGMSGNILNPEGMGFTPVDEETISSLSRANAEWTVLMEEVKTVGMADLAHGLTGFINVLYRFKSAIAVVVAYVSELIAGLENFNAKRGLKAVKENPKAALDLFTGAGQMQYFLEWIFGDKGDTDENANSNLTGLGKIMEGFLGKDTITNAENAAAAAGQVALDEEAARNKRIAALTKKTNRTGTPNRDKDISLGGVSGGPSGVGIGNLIGVNASYRLERLNVEHNKKLDTIIELLRKGNENNNGGLGDVPPQE